MFKFNLIQFVFVVRKKFGGNIFVVYPNRHIYHVNCAPNQNIEPINGKKFLEIN